MRATLNYLKHLKKRPKTAGPASGDETGARSEDFSSHLVEIADARSKAPPLSLDANGFCLIERQSGIENIRDVERGDKAYYSEVEQIVQDVTGAALVVAFDHNFRFENGAENAEADIARAARIVHNDYTETSGMARAREVLTERGHALELADHRFTQINVWRPLTGPVQRAPLAMADATSVRPGDFVETDLAYGGRQGSVYYLTYNQDHRWFYFPNMTASEAILLKGYDSSQRSVVRFVPHTSFDDPNMPADAHPRESIEVRTFAFFGPENG